MPDPRKNKDDLDETKRIMERLVKTPPDHKTGKDKQKERGDSKKPPPLPVTKRG